jgi:hypothetical protein
MRDDGALFRNPFGAGDRILAFCLADKIRLFPGWAMLCRIFRMEN